jgi:hypothetical protein
MGFKEDLFAISDVLGGHPKIGELLRVYEQRPNELRAWVEETFGQEIVRQLRTAGMKLSQQDKPGKGFIDEPSQRGHRPESVKDKPGKGFFDPRKKRKPGPGFFDPDDKRRGPSQKKKPGKGFFSRRDILVSLDGIRNNHHTLPFVPLSSNGKYKRFRKDLIHVGKWVHPDTGQELDFSAERLDQLADETNRWLAAGNKVWFPVGAPAHHSKADQHLGFWSEFEFDGQTLWATVEIRDKETLEKDKVGRTITDVSIGVGPAVDSNGQEFEEVVQHVAATVQPVIPGQGNFIALERRPEAGMSVKRALLGFGLEDEDEFGEFEDESEEEEIGLEDIDADDEEMAADDDVLQDDGYAGLEDEDDIDISLEDEDEDSADLDASALSGVLSLLGLPDDADEGSAMDALRGLFNGESEAEEEPAMQAQPIGMSNLRREVRQLKLENARAKVAAADRLCVNAGVPMGVDVRKRAIRLFVLGRDEDAKAIIGLAVDRARARRSTAGLRTVERRKPGGEMEHRKEHALSLRAAGFSVETDKDWNVIKCSRNGRSTTL